MTFPNPKAGASGVRWAPAFLESQREALRSALEFHDARIAAGSGDTHDIALAMQRRSLSARDEIAAALKRIDDEYGVCVVCGSWISLERLEALPHAAHCADCSGR